MTVGLSNQKKEFSKIQKGFTYKSVNNLKSMRIVGKINKFFTYMCDDLTVKVPVIFVLGAIQWMRKA